MQSFSNVIFDLDGTLLDTSPEILKAIQKTLVDFGIDSYAPLTCDLIGPPIGEIFKAVTGINRTDTLDRLINRYKLYYDEMFSMQSRYFEGMSESLLNLRNANFRFHIATNKRVNPTQVILKHVLMDFTFDSVFALDSRTPSFKSKSEMIRKQMASIGVDRNEIVFIGDSDSDEAAAIENGILFFHAGWGYGKALSPETLSLASPSKLVEHLIKICVE